ncbi:MAG: hypothetical protein AB8B53_13105 [Flavobacteriales bacterium]
MKESIDLFEKLVAQVPEASLGQMFGKPCGKLNKKAFVAFYQDQMVFKIGKEEIAELLHKYEGAQNWDPSGKGRPMKDWIQVPAEFSNHWEGLAEKAIGHLNNAL